MSGQLLSAKPTFSRSYNKRIRRFADSARAGQLPRKINYFSSNLLLFFRFMQTDDDDVDTVVVGGGGSRSIVVGRATVVTRRAAVPTGEAQSA